MISWQPEDFYAGIHLFSFTLPPSPVTFKFLTTKEIQRAILEYSMIDAGTIRYF
jgi:hypothetical protein